MIIARGFRWRVDLNLVGAHRTMSFIGWVGRRSRPTEQTEISIPGMARRTMRDTRLR